MYYRWSNCVKEFDMPVKLAGTDGDPIAIGWLKPIPEWKTVAITGNILKDGLKIDRNFYITVKKAE